MKIGSYKGMKIREFAYTVKDADVDAELERLRERNARKVEVTDRAAWKRAISPTSISSGRWTA